ncbi:MAG: hypothetical protein FWD50_04190 [Betaproteobacteria bacterium]|nr:hypothetical protein [Betaproteobacteria bacterium]
MQLDIFADSVETMLLNDVVNALRRESYLEAEKAMDRLAAQYPDNPALPDATALLVLREFPATVSGHEELSSLFGHVENVIEPAARRLFGNNARQWVNDAAWQHLAVISARLPYCPSHPACHAAAAWMRAQTWQVAIESIMAIPNWRRLPVPLQWMATSTVRNNDLDGAWPLLMELAWMAPPAFAAVLRNLDDPVLSGLLKDFEASFDDNDDDQLCWFPALALAARPALLARVRNAAPARVTDATKAFGCVCGLLLLEKQGRHAEIVKERARLRSLNDQLYARYMRTR